MHYRYLCHVNAIKVFVWLHAVQCSAVNSYAEIFLAWAVQASSRKYYAGLSSCAWVWCFQLAPPPSQASWPNCVPSSLSDRKAESPIIATLPKPSKHWPWKFSSIGMIKKRHSQSQYYIAEALSDISHITGHIYDWQSDQTNTRFRRYTSTRLDEGNSS